MELEIRVDRTRCIGSGECVRLAPGVFDLDSKAISVVVDHRGESEERIVRTMSACPMDAITLGIDGVCIGPEDLRNWMDGTDSTDPIVSLLEQLYEEHDELLGFVTSTPADGRTDRAEKMWSLATMHLQNEAEAYSSLAALVDPDLVDTFEGGHARIDRALKALAADESNQAMGGQAMTDLKDAVHDQIRLEETLLFPVVLAALARGRRARSTPG
jgi:ferredoxin